jgi:hypothetical protein
MKAFGVILVLLGGVMVVATPLVRGLSFWPQNLSFWVAGIVGLIVLIIGGVLLSFGEGQSFKPDKQLLKTEDAYPCPICNQKDFTWGILASPSAARFRRGTPGIAGYGTPVLTRLCNHCGNLVLFALEKRP